MQALKAAEREWTDKDWPRLGKASSSGGKGASASSSGANYGKAGAWEKGSWESSGSPGGFQFKGQDNLIIGGFPKDSTAAFSDQGAQLVWARLSETTWAL